MLTLLLAFTIRRYSVFGSRVFLASSFTLLTGFPRCLVYIRRKSASRLTKMLASKSRPSSLAGNFRHRAPSGTFQLFLLIWDDDILYIPRNFHHHGTFVNSFAPLRYIYMKHWLKCSVQNCHEIWWCRYVLAIVLLSVLLLAACAFVAIYSDCCKMLPWICHSCLLWSSHMPLMAIWFHVLW